MNEVRATVVTVENCPASTPLRPLTSSRLLVGLPNVSLTQELCGQGMVQLLFRLSACHRLPNFAPTRTLPDHYDSRQWCRSASSLVMLQGTPYHFASLPSQSTGRISVEHASGAPESARLLLPTSRLRARIPSAKKSV